MALDFSIGGYENLFRKALAEGINLFCGAGFSVEAYNTHGEKLMLGNTMLDRLKEEFPSIKSYTTLPRASTTLMRTEKEAFFQRIREWFTVGKIAPGYLSLLKIKLGNIYTTNIDDLFFRIFEASDNLYLIDRSINGAPYQDNYAVNYFPLHGCVNHEHPKYIFGVNDIASAFSQTDSKQSWESLAEDAAKNAILFWGWNFNDSDVIEAIYTYDGRTNQNIKRWFLLRKHDEEIIDFLRNLNFNIIIGDTSAMLEYIADFSETPENRLRISYTPMPTLQEYLPPANDETLPSYPLQKFFLEYTPQWYHIYSGEVPKTIHYNRIADMIASGKDVIATGIRGSGKTTLCMQLAAGHANSHFMVAPSKEQALRYIKLLNGRRSLLFVDDCFRDVNAVIAFIEAKNIQAVCFDRDLYYESLIHKITPYLSGFEVADITQITINNAQSILDIIPSELKRDNAGTQYFDKDMTILNLLASNLKAVNFSFMDKFHGKDPDEARVFLMIAYVHSCGVPCSYDMVHYFLGSKKYSWQGVLNIIDSIGKLIKDASGWMKYYSLDDAIEDYYQCRSRFLAERIIGSIPRGDELFAHMLNDFTRDVPCGVICLYDKFRRSFCDSLIAWRAFPDISEGEKFYRLCLKKDESEYGCFVFCQSREI